MTEQRHRAFFLTTEMEELNKRTGGTRIINAAIILKQNENEDVKNKIG